MIHSKMHGRYLGIFIITYDVDAAQGLGDFGTSPPPALTLKRCLLMVSDQHVWTHILQLNSTETPVQIFEATIQSGKIQVRQSLLNRLCKTTYPPCLSLTSGKTNILGPHISKRAPNFRGDDRFLFPFLSFYVISGRDYFLCNFSRDLRHSGWLPQVYIIVACTITQREHTLYHHLSTTHARHDNLRATKTNCNQKTQFFTFASPGLLGP